MLEKASENEIAGFQSFTIRMGEAKTAMNVIDMNVNSSSDLSLESRVAMLNTDQRRIFDNVKSHLLHQQRSSGPTTLNLYCNFR